MPTLTYEISRGLAQKEIMATHVTAVIEALRETQRRRVA